MRMALASATYHHHQHVFNATPQLYDSSTPSISLTPSSHPPPSPVKPYTNGIENEIVVINISGKRFEIYLSTLEKFPNTLLGDPNKRTYFYNKATGEYFFERCRKSFNGILQYYHSNGVIEKPSAVTDSIFTQEVIFFELSDHLFDMSNPSNNTDPIALPNNPILAKIWIAFEKPSSSITSKLLAIVSITIILLSIVVFCLETVPQLDPDTAEGRHMYTIWLVLNSICNIWFTLEYIIRFIAAPNKLLFLKSTLNIVDLLSILPFYFNLIVGDGEEGHKFAVLRVIRVIRVIRIFKLTRHSRGLHVLANTVRASGHELAMLMLFLAIGVILFSSAVYFAESHTTQSGFHSIPHGFWWAVVTMTTVGYGDLYPSTLLGKFVGTLCAISGVLVIALPVPVIVSNFEYYYKQEQSRQARENEYLNKLHYEEALPTIQKSMKMMTEASIVLAGGHRDTNQTAQPTLKSRARAKISFSFHSPLSTTFERKEDIIEANGDNHSSINEVCQLEKDIISYDDASHKKSKTYHERKTHQCSSIPEEPTTTQISNV